jgi:DNA-directed RNA polymerase subunit RPC12/RpoP
MKTAMQELMDALNDLEAVYIQNDWRREVIGINQAKNLIEYIYLKKEKEQIINANRDGVDMVVDKKDFISGEQYYNETFNTTKTSTHGGLKSLDEHNSNAWSTQVNMYSDDPRRNGIACPECGNELMDTNPMMTLTSHPAKKNVHCPKCEYKGYRIV